MEAAHALTLRLTQTHLQRVHSELNEEVPNSMLGGGDLEEDVEGREDG